MISQCIFVKKSPVVFMTADKMSLQGLKILLKKAFLVVGRAFLMFINNESCNEISF